ncbi:phospholipase D family protein [Flavobacteriaceae bacterium M23B6Z8]
MNLKKFEFENCIPLQNAAYFNSLLTQLKNAKRRIWINFFYINILPDRDINYLSRELFEVIISKFQDGLNVKVALGTKDDLSNLGISNKVVLKFLHQYNIPCQLYDGSRMFSHSKYILIDDKICIIGSHNWSDRSLTEGIDDSLLITSESLTQYLSNDFFQNWT